MISFEIGDYYTAHKVVKCKADVYADLATGRRLIERQPTVKANSHDSKQACAGDLEPCTPFEYNDAYFLYEGSKSKYVNKKLVSPVYAVTYNADESSVGICIWSANEVNKHGANWKKYKEYILLASMIEEFSLNNYDPELGECLALVRNDLAKTDTLFPRPINNSREKMFSEFPKYEVLKALLGANFTPETVFNLIVTCRYMRLVSNERTLKIQKFGVEIEFTGLTRKEAIEVVAKHFEGSAACDKVFDRDMRAWLVKSDGSIRTTHKDGSPAGKEYCCELITPICTYEDIPLIQEIVRSLRRAGMCVNETCGIHVHVDGKYQTAFTLKALTNFMASNEDNLFEALGVEQGRIARYCQKTDRGFLQRINAGSVYSIWKMEELWYNGDTTRHHNYNSTRYHALNLHSLWQNKGIEFRMFNSTTHAGKIKAYIQLCLAICNYSLSTTDSINAPKPEVMDYKHFRSWLLGLGLEGDEFKTARIHLLANFKEKSRSNAA